MFVSTLGVLAIITFFAVISNALPFSGWSLVALRNRKPPPIRHGPLTAASPTTTFVSVSSISPSVASSKETGDPSHFKQTYPCGITAITPATWKSLNVSHWLNLHLERFRDEAQYSTSTNFITDYMIPNFFQDVAPSQMQCNTMAQCSIGSCQNLNSDLDAVTRQMAWYVIEAIANFNNYLNIVHEAVQDTAIKIAAQLEPLVQDFSSVEKEAAQIEMAERQEKLIMAAALGVSLISSAAFPGFYSIRAGSEAFDAAMNAIPGTIAGIHAGGNSIGAMLFPLDFEDWVHQTEVELARFFSKSLNDFELALKGPGTTILNGWHDEHGKDLLDILGQGHFAQAVEINPVNLSKLLMEYWVGISVNHLWTQSRTYIIMSNTTSCQEDCRGPNWTKVCLLDEPQKVFYVYYLNRAQEEDHMVEQVAQPLPPPGFDKIIKGRNVSSITLDKVVQSSYDYYKKFNHTPMGELKGQALGLDDFDRRKHDIWSLGAGYRGIFNIPICRDDHGRFISSTADDDSRNYPCICGPSDGADRNTWDFTVDETAGFLHATDLRYSADFPTYCEFNMGCITEDKSWHEHALAEKYPKGDQEDVKHMTETTASWHELTRFKLDAAYTECPKHNAHVTQGRNGGDPIPICKSNSSRQS